jgi:hypothetical protein
MEHGGRGLSNFVHLHPWASFDLDWTDHSIWTGLIIRFGLTDLLIFCFVLFFVFCFFFVSFIQPTVTETGVLVMIKRMALPRGKDLDDKPIEHPRVVPGVSFPIELESRPLGGQGRGRVVIGKLRAGNALIFLFVCLFVCLCLFVVFIEKKKKFT